MPVQRISFYVLLVLVSLAFVAVVLPFYSAIFWAVVLAIIFFPLHVKLEAGLGGRHPNIAAGLSVLVCVCLVIIPGLIILSSLIQQGNNLYQRIDNGESLCIAKFEPTRDLRVHAMIGRRRPLHAGSYKVLLAYLPPQVQAQMIPEKLERFTARTITTRARLEAELKRVREAGHCVSRGEVSDQLVSVSVPVLAFDGSVIAAVNIAAPAFRTQDSDIPRYIALLKNAARKISEGLGW